MSFTIFAKQDEQQEILLIYEFQFLFLVMLSPMRHLTVRMSKFTSRCYMSNSYTLYNI